MKKIKLLTLLPLLAAPLMMTGCNGNSNGKVVIGICQIADHPALNAATEGFKEAVLEELGEDKVTFNFRNANGDGNILVNIMSTFVNDKVDLIMANATPCVQVASNATRTIPILGTSVTDYGVALDIDNFDGVVGENISGTSDLAPLDRQADMFDELLPDAKKIGLVYCSSEPNSKFQIDTIEPILQAKGLTTERVAFSEANTLPTTLSAQVRNYDALYIPTDNACAANATTIDSICRNAKVPVICGEEGICAGCGIATLSINYTKLGKLTGKMAARILKDGADISKMAIEYDTEPSKLFNKEICEELNITVPASYTEIKK